MIRNLYLYLVSGICVVMMLISTVGVVNLVLKEYVFDVKSYDEMQRVPWACEDSNSEVEKYPGLSQEECIVKEKAIAAAERENENKRDLVWFFSMLIVALPLYLFHWKKLD